MWLGDKALVLEGTRCHLMVTISKLYVEKKNKTQVLQIKMSISKTHGYVNVKYRLKKSKCEKYMTNDISNPL
jgi:hypothetical protein